MIEIIIDGKKLEVAPDTTILAAAQQAGVKIPTLCHSELVKPAGTCRVCSVEVDTGERKRLLTACNTLITQPLEVFTQSEAARRTRAQVLERMLARWPNVRRLQELARAEGVTGAPEKPHPKQSLHPNACVQCGLCIRLCGEALWHHVLVWEGQGAERRVVMKNGGVPRECVGCGACAFICPTGAIRMLDDPNHPADADRIRRAGMGVTREVILLDKQQCHMREMGTSHLVEIMNDYDLLPVHNYRFGGHPDHKFVASWVWGKKMTQGAEDGCALGCDMACAKAVDGFELKTGPDKGKRVVVDGPEYETVAGCTNMGVFDPDWIVEMNYYCDHYGIDTISFGTLMAFAMECYELGVLTRERTGGLELGFGAKDAALEVLHQMARGEGFGLVAGLGVRRMKKKFAEEYGADPRLLEDIGMENKGLEYSEYVSKESLAQQGGFGITLKGPQHDEAWLIFMDMVNKQIPTFEDKAEALHYFPMWRTWFGLAGLCKLPWNDVEPEDNAESEAPAKVPKHVQAYCDFWAGMTGEEVTGEDLVRKSERVYNFQRVFNLRMGFGTRIHDRIPYRSQGPVTEVEYLSRQERYDKQLQEEVGLQLDGLSTADKVAALRKYREGRYQKLLDAVYKRRGWNSNGIPTLKKVRELGIDKVPGLVELLAAHGVRE